MGWFGGCGEMNCTGPDNILIHDTDGKFVEDAIGAAIPSQIYGQGVYQKGNSESSYDEAGTQCQYKEGIKGYICKHEKLVLLQYESIAPDSQRRIIWPIKMYDDELFDGKTAGTNYSLTNGWKEW